MRNVFCKIKMMKFEVIMFLQVEVNDSECELAWVNAWHSLKTWEDITCFYKFCSTGLSNEARNTS
jgi:hypothetical protein